MSGSPDSSPRSHSVVLTIDEIDDLTKFSSPDGSLKGSSKSTLKKPTPKTIYELEDVHIYDITKTKSHIAMVDSDYKLHVYKISNDFEKIEEMEFWEIYNSVPGEQCISSATHAGLGTFEIKICEQQPESVIYVCLSISGDGRFAALSISTEENDQTKVNDQTGKNHQNESNHQNEGKSQTNKESQNETKQQSKKQYQNKVIIFTTDTKFKIKKNSWPLNQSITMSKDIKYARPVFTEDKFILATDKEVRIFDFKFQKKSTIELSYFRQFFPGFSFTLYDSASCNLIDNRKDIWKKDKEVFKRFKYQKRFMDNVGTRSLVTSTEFIRQNVLLENCGSQVVRVWSTKNDTLIASIKKELQEKIIAISDVDHKYFATFNQSKRTIAIYSTQTNSRLHEINLATKQFKENSTGIRGGRMNINYGSFQFDNSYLFISGHANKGFGPPHPQKDQGKQKVDDKEFTFFELWNIPAQRRVYQKKINGHRFPRKKPLFFVTECKNNDSLSVTYIKISHPDIPPWKWDSSPPSDPRKLEKTIFEISIRNELNATVQNDSETNQWKKWKPNRPSKEIGNHWKTKMIGHDVFYMLDHPKPHLKRYLLDTQNGRYVLLFSPFIVQLWRLTSTDEADRLNRPRFIHRSDTHDNFLIEKDSNESKSYRNLIFQNELVYTHHYKKDILIRDETLKKNRSNQLTMDEIEIEFDAGGCSGRTLIYQKLSRNCPPTNSNKYQCIYELFLPMERILQDIPSISTAEEASASHSDATVTSNSSLGTEKDTQATEITNEKSQRAEFHYFESTIRALCYIESVSSEEDEFLVEDMLRSTAGLLEKLFQEYEDTDYFATEAGSYSLYILAQSKKCHTLIENILLKGEKEEGKDTIKKVYKSTPINLSGPFDPKNKLLNGNKTTRISGVNIFIALLKQNQILFFLFFHHVLIDSRTRGIGNLAPITDLLLYLQKEKKIDILLRCTQMMAYFPVPLSHAIQEKEIQDAFVLSFSLNYRKKLVSFTLPEKLKRKEFGKWYSIFKRLENPLSSKNLNHLWEKVEKIFKEHYDTRTYQEPDELTDFYVSDCKILCMVPFPNSGLHTQMEENYSSPTNLDSLFTKIVSSRTFKDLFIRSNAVIEAMTIYKWKNFAFLRFILVLFIYAMYYISFTVGVCFAKEVFKYSPGDSNFGSGHIATLVIMFLSWFLLCLQEVRQFLNNKRAYMVLYNLIDWAALVMPIASLILLLNNGQYVNEVASATTLVLWTHGVLRLRAFRTLGTILEFIIQISVKTLPFICVFFAVVVAFTHAFMVLLRQKDDAFFQEQYSGTFGSTTSQNNNLVQGEVTFTDISSQNKFSNPFTALFSVWFFIYGAWDSINDGDAGDDTMVMLLLMLFSFIICLIFFNMIIALMSSTIDKAKKRGKKNWIHHLAAVVSEIELFWCLPTERRDKVKNPSWIYYVADIEEYKEQEKRLNGTYESYLQRYTKDRKNNPSFYEMNSFP